MALRVFLDVGANNGQTLAAVLPMKFDRIVCFEPAPDCWPKLEAVAEKRAWIERFGLWDKDCVQAIYQPGSQGAGLWKKDRGLIDTTADCQFRKASDWFRDNISAKDTVYLKLNVEGAECDILDDLLDSGEFAKVSYLMVDFDVRKIASMAHREAETRERLSAYPAPRVQFCKDVMRGETHVARIQHWLSLCR